MMAMIRLYVRLSSSTISKISETCMLTIKAFLCRFVRYNKMYVRRHSVVDLNLFKDRSYSSISTLAYYAH